jgi:hypothetical protein
VTVTTVTENVVDDLVATVVAAAANADRAVSNRRTV